MDSGFEEVMGLTGNWGGVMCRRLRATEVKIALVYSSSGGPAADVVEEINASGGGYPD